MKKIVLDITRMHSVPALHNYLRSVLALPVYYGANLDALHDCLMDLGEAVEVVVPAAVADETQLGWYGKQFLQVLQDAAYENANLKVTLK